MVTKTNDAKFENGATRSHHAPHYELLTRPMIDRLVSRLMAGAKIHGKHNWKGGEQEFMTQCKRHLMGHVLMFMQGNKDDDHLSAILANAAFLADGEARGILPED